MKKCKTIAFTLSKGGVGKTTTTLNIGAALAVEGYRVCIVDNDPQGNLLYSDLWITQESTKSSLDITALKQLRN